MEKLIYLIKEDLPIKVNATEIDKNTNHNTYLLEDDYHEDWRDRKVVDGKLVVDLEEQLTQAKANKLKLLHQECEKAYSSGFYIGDLFYQSDTHDRENLDDAFVAAQAILSGMVTDIETIPYESGLKDGLHTPHQPLEISNIKTQFLMFKSMCIAEATRIKNELIVPAKTLEELEAISCEINILQG